MYLLIFEDMTIKQTNEVSKNDFEAVNEGVLSIIDISGDDALEYNNGDWTKVKVA